MASGSMADAAPALIVHQIGDCDGVTGAVTYQATVDEGGRRPLALSFTLLAFNFFGDGLRDAFDPRQKR